MPFRKVARAWSLLPEQILEEALAGFLQQIFLGGGRLLGWIGRRRILGRGILGGYRLGIAAALEGLEQPLPFAAGGRTVGGIGAGGVFRGTGLDGRLGVLRTQEVAQETP